MIYPALSALCSSLASTTARIGLALSLISLSAAPGVAQGPVSEQEALALRGRWEPLGELVGAGPYARQLVSVALEPDHLYASSSVGLLRSTDRGATWGLHATWPVDGGGLPRFAVSPTDPDRIVLSFLLQGMWISGDGGASWAELALPPEVTTFWGVACDPVVPDVLHVGASNGVWRSGDGGATFTHTLPLSGYARDVLIDRNNRNRLYASVPGQGVYVSEDGGDSWMLNPYPAGTSTPLSVALDPTNGRRLLLGSAGTYLTEDKGATWTLLGPSTPFVDAVGFDPYDPERFHAGWRNEGLATSDDKGATWAVNLDPGLARLGGTPQGILSSPAHPGDVLVTGYGGLARSTDHGATFARANDGLEAFAYITSLAIDPFDGDHLVAKTGGWAFTSFDGGASWIESAAGHAFVGSDVVADAAIAGRFYAGGQFANGGRLWRSDDGGLSFAPVWEDPSVYFFHLEPHPFLGGVVFGAGDGVRRSDDGGVTWTSLGAPDNWVWDVAVSEADPNRVYSVGYLEAYLSDDAGGTWTTTALTGPTPRDVAVDPNDADRAWIALPGYGGDPTQGVYGTLDAGATWAKAAGPVNDASIVHTSRYHPNLLFAGDQGRRRVQASFTGGSTFFDVGQALPSAATDLASSPSRVYAGSIGHGVFLLVR